MHKRIDFHLDKVRSARLDPDLHKDQSLNISQEKMFSTLVDTFQLKEYIRDELKPLVKNDAPVTFVGSIIAFPSDYRHLIGLAVWIDGVKVDWPVQQSYDEKSQSFDNSFASPQDDEPNYIESDGGLNVYTAGGSITQATMDYIRAPKTIYYSQTFLNNTATLVVGTMYYVQTGSVVYNSVTYNQGDTFVAVIGFTSFTGTGTLAAIQNCELGPTCQEEICKIASAIISGTLDDYGRFQVKAEEGKR